ncbi:MAG: DNA-directed RNA polymerase subunit D [Candidatus Woesearchaeota archaeon]|nr:MAG: DNA-directed RNA polymerase subunit D [Candidatus Woesearchaeota archaeon]
MVKISNILVDEDLEKTFVIEDANSAFVNEIKRAAASQVPVMAIEDIFFIDNSSALYDEILAQRLGLIPLTTGKEYKLKETCKCKGKGCALCRAKLTLKVKGPKMVYASDLEAKDPKVKPIYPEMLIVELLEGQEIELEAHAILGIGEEHAKWSPCLAYYQKYPKITIDQKKVSVKVALEHCPKDVFEVENKKLKVKNLLNCNLCKSCEDRTNGAIKISGEASKYIFTIESWGQLPPQDILKQSVKIINSKIKDAKLK